MVIVRSVLTSYQTQFGPAMERLVVLFSEAERTQEDINHSPHSEMSPPALAMRREHFTSLTSAFSIPLSYLSMMEDAETVFLKEQQICSSDDGAVSSILLQHCSSTNFKFSAVVSHDSSKRLTLALIHGLKAHEITDLTDQIRSNLFTIVLPTLIPTLQLTGRVNSAVAKIRESHDSIVQIERDTGVRTNWHLSKPSRALHMTPPPDGDRFQSVDFDHVTKELTGVLTKMAYCEFISGAHLPMLDDLDAIHEKLVTIDDSYKEKRKVAARTLRVLNEYLKSDLRGVSHRAQYLSKRSQALVQIVFSLISQRENALSLRDNDELKKTSTNQGRVALAASRDSAAMRVIAVITIVFLPATFTAALFSTTFFNFESGHQGTTVSWWLWLYFVVTICLSAVIFAWWYIPTNRKQQEVDTLLRDENAEKV